MPYYDYYMMNFHQYDFIPYTPVRRTTKGISQSDNKTWSSQAVLPLLQCCGDLEGND